MGSISAQTSAIDALSGLTPLQQRMWFLENLDTSQSQLNIVNAYKIEGKLDPIRIQENLNSIVDSYADLRMTFVEQGSTVIRQTMDKLDSHIELTALQDSFEDNRTFVRNLISELESYIFDLAIAPLFKVKLLTFAESQSLLLLVGHRLILDLASLDWIAQQLLSDKILIQIEEESKDKEKLSIDQDMSQLLEQLDDASLVCELPTDLPRPSYKSAKSDYFQITLQNTAYNSLMALSQRHSVSPQIIALSMYIALIYRYTMQSDILVGCMHRNTLKAVGAFEDTVVVRHLFDKQDRVSDLIKSIANSYQPESNEGYYPPFTKLIDALNPARDLSRSPIVQHGFAYLSSLSLEINNSIVERLYHSAPMIQMDLMLSYCQRNSAIDLIWHYDPSLFTESTIARFHQHYEQMLLSVEQNHSLAVGQIILTSPEEFNEITVVWNQSEHTVEDFDFVYRLFEKQAQRTPDAVAVMEPGKQLTYRQLDELSNQLAHWLVAEGVTADTVVAIMEDRNINFLLAMLAINKSGGAFLPLSPLYPQKRISRILEISESLIILTGDKYISFIQETIDDIPNAKTKLIELSDSIEKSTQLSIDSLPARCEFHHLAYVIFTSGSTGEPKGAMVEHAGMINHNYSKVYDLEMTHVDIMAQTARQTFDIMVWQFVTALMVGATVYVMPDEIALDAIRLLEEIDKCKITIVQLVPVNIEAILDIAMRMGENRPKLTNLRWMVPTGDALHTDLCRRWLTAYPNTRMLNAYGATECSDDQCSYVITPDLPSDYRPLIMTIGRPIINTQIYILDDWMQVVPIGAVGELYVGGIGVGRGYLKDSERTNAAFVPNPFDNLESKLYKSGDQARYLPDGTIEFLGRIGHMIKIRGFRIEPGEIQSVMNRHESVAQSVITTHDYEGIGKQLIAYVVLRPHSTSHESEIRDFARLHLPDYMVPQFIVFLDDVPLNANGKIDRKSLPIPTLGEETRDIIPPTNVTEQKLLTLWKSTLKHETISVHDNFFDIGGHSLLAIQLFAGIYSEFGEKLPLASIFSSPTIRDLARLLDEQNKVKSDLKCVVQIQKGSSDRPPIFCIHAHGGHILVFYNFAKHLGSDQTVYGIQALGVDGNVKPLNRFEDIAKTYIAEIKSVQPNGPYYFVGDCMGGTIGFEITKQLEAQNEEVKLLLMIESFCGGNPQLKPGVSKPVYEVIFTIQRFREFYLQNLMAPHVNKVEYMKEIFQRGIYSFRRRILSRVIGNRLSSDPLMATQAALFDAERRYQPSPIRTAITLFNSRLPWGVVDDDTLGWSSYSIGGVHIHKFDLFYGTLLEHFSEVEHAARELRKILDDELL